MNNLLKLTSTYNDVKLFYHGDNEQYHNGDLTPLDDGIYLGDCGIIVIKDKHLINTYKNIYNTNGVIIPRKLICFNVKAEDIRRELLAAKTKEEFASALLHGLIYLGSTSISIFHEQMPKHIFGEQILLKEIKAFCDEFKFNFMLTQTSVVFRREQQQQKGKTNEEKI